MSTISETDIKRMISEGKFVEYVPTDAVTLGLRVEGELTIKLDDGRIMSVNNGVVFCDGTGAISCMNIDEVNDKYVVYDPDDEDDEDNEDDEDDCDDDDDDDDDDYMDDEDEDECDKHGLCEACTGSGSVNNNVAAYTFVCALFFLVSMCLAMIIKC